ncbi:ATP-binding cassette domain-containing protein [Rhodobacteraceae bacterium NNCM2]|nr:ATP-binding cassette domain-containing protein [Coraliihabitans acroporae]
MLTIEELRTSLIGPVSLVVEAGECVSVEGPSGSGKSLLLRAIADLDPNQGAVRLNGMDRDLMPADRWRRRVALVPAESAWWSDAVADHFDPAHPAADLLQQLGLPDALDWQVSRLSTGERQRLAIARALGRAPEALLLDEPTAALDEAATRAVEEVIRAACSAGKPVILVTHDAAQARRLAARHFVMGPSGLTPAREAGA